MADPRGLQLDHHRARTPARPLLRYWRSPDSGTTAGQVVFAGSTGEAPSAMMFIPRHVGAVGAQL